MTKNLRGFKASKVVCITVLLFLSVFAALIPSVSAADWTKKDLGNVGGTVNAVAIGDANNDGEPEVYAASSNGGAFMLKQNPNDPVDWKTVTLGYGEGQSFSMSGVAVGDGMNIGKNNTYAGGWTQGGGGGYQGKMYEFSLDKGQWTATQMGTGGWGITDVAIGDGRNSGKTNVYASSWDNHIYEYTYSNGWNGRDMGTVNGWNAMGVTVGDCNNDGKNEVYSMSAWNGDAYMFTYSSSTRSWSSTSLGQPPSGGQGWTYLTGITCGDGNNDGKNELYFSGFEYGYSLTYSSGSHSWTWDTIFDNGWQTQNRVAVGDGDADGNNEVYITSDTNNVYALIYSGGSWTSSSVGSGNGAMAGVTVGDGDTFRGQDEIYAGCADSHVYQFMMDITPPPNPIVWSPTHTPNQWSNNSNIVVMWKMPPDPSGIFGYSWEWTTDPNTNPDQKIDGKGGEHQTNSGPLADGDSYYFHIKAVDGALNWNRSATHFGPLMIDTVAPTNIGLSINNGAQYTNSKLVSLGVSGNDARSGMGYMAFSDDGTKYPAFDTWEAWSTPRANWDLTDVNWGGNDNDGSKTVFMKARDKAGNVAPGFANGTIFLDRKQPVGLSIKINDGAMYASSDKVTLTLTAQDPDPASGLFQMRFSNDDINWSSWESWSAVRNGWSLTKDAGGKDIDGKKFVYFEVQDKAGNIAGPMSSDIYLDRSPPGSLRLIINGGAQYTNVTDVKLNISANDPDPGSGLDKMHFSNDDTTFSSWEDYTSSKNPWSLTIGSGGNNNDGVKPVYMAVKDKVGNVGGPIKSTIFLDRAKPIKLKLVINNGATLTNKLNVMLNMSAVDPDPASGLDSMRIQEQGGAWTNWMPWQSLYNFTISPGDGAKTVCFMVRDKANNWAGPECSSIVLDTTPPVITNIRVISITDMSAIITWSTDSPADSVVDYGVTNTYGNQKKDIAFLSDHSITLAGLTPTTTYHFRVASTDEVGNGPTVSPDYTFTTTATPDRTPPIITNLRVEGITDTLAIVLWETNEPSNSRVNYGTTTSYGLVAGNDQNVQTHSITLLGLTPATTYYVEVMSTDPSGNGPTNATTQFQTKVTPDTTAPIITNVKASSITDKMAVITWTTDEVANSIVEFGTTTAYGKVITDPAFVKDHMITLNGLSPATTYYFIVRSTDPSGNGPTTSAQYNFQTSVTPDMTPPAISDVKASGLTNTMAIITWNTDELADGSVDFGTAQTYGLKADEIGFNVAHSVTLTGLKPSTTYHFRVLSKDMSGNGPSKSADYTFTTLAMEDKEPPIITNVHVEGVNSNVAVVIWNTNEVADSQVEFGMTTAYGEVTRDSAFIAVHSIALKGLNASMTYHFRVKSTDVSGNGPSISNDFTFQTTGILDQTPPSITGVAITGITQTSAKVSWITNEPANTYIIFAKNGSSSSQVGDPDHYVTNHTWTLSGLEPGTTYTIRVVSIDPSNNKGNSTDLYKFKTLDKSVKPPPGGGGGSNNNNNNLMWLLYVLIIAIIVGCIIGGVYLYKTRQTAQPMAYGVRQPRGSYAAEGETTEVEEMQMDDAGGVQELNMDDGAEDLGTVDMGSEEGVETLDMGDEGGDVELGSAITAVTSAPAARPKKPVRTVMCPGCKSAIPLYSATQTDIKCPKCGKEGRIKPMKAPPPVEETAESDLSPLGSVLGSEPDIPLPPPPKAAPKASARPKPATTPPKGPLKTLTCSGCRGKVPIYTDKRPIKITCPSCGKSGTLKN